MLAIGSTTGSQSWGKSESPIGVSPETAAKTPAIIKQFNSSGTTGAYWLKTPAGVRYQVYMDMTTAGGGWINLNNGSVGPYGVILTASNGSGGGNLASGGSSTFGAALSGPSVNQNQAGVYSCGGSAGVSSLILNSQFLSDLGITQVRFNCTISNMSNVTCGYVNSNQGAITIISGNSNNFSVCNNPPNQYSQVNPSSFTCEGYATLTNGTSIFLTYTACSGSMNVAVNQIWVK